MWRAQATPFPPDRYSPACPGRVRLDTHPRRVRLRVHGSHVPRENQRRHPHGHAGTVRHKRGGAPRSLRGLLELLARLSSQPERGAEPQLPCGGVRPGRALNLALLRDQAHRGKYRGRRLLGHPPAAQTRSFMLYMVTTTEFATLLRSMHPQLSAQTRNASGGTGPQPHFPHAGVARRA